MDDSDRIDPPEVLAGPTTTCVRRPSRFTRGLQWVASVFCLLLALLPGFVGAANLFFYQRNVMRGVDWLLLGTGALLVLLSLISLFKPARAARWMGMISVIGFAIVIASGTGLLSPVSTDSNIALLCTGSFFFVFLLTRYLARPHYPANDGPACSHCAH